MKCVALVYVVLFLSGCSSTPGVRSAMENGDVYVGVGMSVEKLNIKGDLRSIRDSQFAGDGLSQLYVHGEESEDAISYQLLLGSQLTKAMDLEATVFTNLATPLNFSSSSRVRHPSVEYSTTQDAYVRETGATLTTLFKWRFDNGLSLFARLGGSYNSTTLNSKLDRDSGYRAAGNEVQYRATKIQPVWSVGAMLMDLGRIEYQTRKIPLGTIASEARNSSGQSFDAATISDSETLHSIMITIRIGLKNLFN